MNPRLLATRAGGLAAALLSLAPAAAGPLPPPQWTPGQTWSVVVRSESRRLLDRPRDGVWYARLRGTPRVWHFEVTGSTEIEGFPARRLGLRAAREDAGEPAVELDFIARVRPDGTVLTLAVEAVRFGDGANRVVRDLRAEAAGPSPVVLRAAPLPVDFPYMDVAEPGTRRFKKTRRIGTLPFADDLEQVVLDGEPAREKARALGVDPGKRQAFVVELRRPLDREVARQVWVEGDPWPAWADTGLAESTLLR